MPEVLQPAGGNHHNSVASKLDESKIRSRVEMECGYKIDPAQCVKIRNYQGNSARGTRRSELTVSFAG